MAFIFSDQQVPRAATAMSKLKPASALAAQLTTSSSFKKTAARPARSALVYSSDRLTRTEKDRDGEEDFGFD